MVTTYGKVLATPYQFMQGDPHELGLTAEPGTELYWVDGHRWTHDRNNGYASLRLTHFPGGPRGPVMLAPGFAMRAASFNLATTERVEVMALEKWTGKLLYLKQSSDGEPFHTLADEAAWWISYLPDQWERSGWAFERRLVDAAVEALSSLAPSQGEQVLLHQDLHGDNVLAAQREP